MICVMMTALESLQWLNKSGILVRDDPSNSTHCSCSIIFYDTDVLLNQVYHLIQCKTKSSHQKTREWTCIILMSVFYISSELQYRLIFKVCIAPSLPLKKEKKLLQMIHSWWQSLSSILLLTLSIHYMYTHMFIITIQVMKNKPFNHKGIEKQRIQNILLSLEN